RIFNEIPVKIFFFDVLYFKQSLIEKAYEKRRKILETIVKNHTSKQIIPYSLGKAKKFLDQAINEGHEGLIAKELKSKYEPGKRSKAWLKIKPFITLDLVIIAAEWGHGRRKGWLSNYHLAARDREGYAMLGKTFKGLTDEEFEYLTQRLLSIKIKEEGNVVYVKPEVVVEVAFNEIQKSRQYPSGFALRFARIVGIREDKSPEEIDTLDKVKSIAGFEAPYEA
ncbi:MAG: ATP-dependent DNA ligase, partial [Candidatus Hydrothermarchaeota archaeon]